MSTKNKPLRVFRVRLHYRVNHREVELDKVVLAADDTEARKKALKSDHNDELITYVQGGQTLSPTLEYAEVKFIAKVDIP